MKIVVFLSFRTGKRGIMGLLKDGINATVRYFMNNFYDGYRQVYKLIVDLGLTYKMPMPSGFDLPARLRLLLW